MTPFDRLVANQKFDKTMVVVSRHWARPKITVSVTDERIAISTAMADFIAALASEIGNPAFILTRKQLRARLEAAAEVALEKVKESSREVMNA